MKILNLGCGTNIMKNAINIDIHPLEGVNIIHDLNDIPYPFEDESIDKIYMKDILEHLNNPIEVINECYRLLKKGGKLKIKVAYWSHFWAYSDPQHKHSFSERYFEPFIGKRRPYYCKNHFSSLKISHIFDNQALVLYGLDKSYLLREAYNKINIIQGLKVILTK